VLRTAAPRRRPPRPIRASRASSTQRASTRRPSASRFSATAVSTRRPTSPA
jgi:hypothetical protein